MSNFSRLFFKIILLCLVIFFLVTPDLEAQQSDSYSHVSFVEGSSRVIKAQSRENLAAIVNLPLLPGDRIETGDRGRCEIQFSNGTLIRLDNNTSLRINTVLANSLTSHWKITTLDLLKGRLYSMNKVYNRELFQIKTRHSAIRLLKTGICSIATNDASTHLHLERGKAGIMFGNESKTGKKFLKGSKKGYIITSDNQVKADNSTIDPMFQLWNETINRDFDKLHRGISALPKPLYRYPPAVINFAERWSSVYGEWLYDKIFGYIWHPYDQSFTMAGVRPFYNAYYLTVDGKPFLVPQEKWGWAPAHLGTWVFLKKRGWVWIPGSAFSTGITGWPPFYRGLASTSFTPQLINGIWDPYRGIYRLYPSIQASIMTTAIAAGAIALQNELSSRIQINSLNSWLDRIYGDMDLYRLYRNRGRRAWEKAYSQKFGKKPAGKKQMSRKIPKQIRSLVSKINDLPVAEVNRRLGPIMRQAEKSGIDVAGFQQAIQSRSTSGRKFKPAVRGAAVGSAKVRQPVRFGTTVSVRAFLDWNPDITWARYFGVDVVYSSQENQVICPDLRLESSRLNGMQKRSLRQVGVIQSVRFSAAGAGPGVSGAVSTGSGRAGTANAVSRTSRSTSTAKARDSSRSSASTVKK